MLAVDSSSNDVFGAAQVLPLQGGRLHLNEGPIDLIIGAEGEPAAVSTAYQRIARRFEGLLGELVAELPICGSRSERPLIDFKDVLRR